MVLRLFKMQNRYWNISTNGILEWNLFIEIIEATVKNGVVHVATSYVKPLKRQSDCYYERAHQPVTV